MTTTKRFYVRISRVTKGKYDLVDSRSGTVLDTGFKTPLRRIASAMNKAEKR